VWEEIWILPHRGGKDEMKIKNVDAEGKVGPISSIKEEVISLII